LPLPNALRVAEERCALEDPALLPVERDRLVACHVLPFRAEASA